MRSRRSRTSSWLRCAPWAWRSTITRMAGGSGCLSALRYWATAESSPRSHSSSTALSSCEVSAVFTDTQPRCSAPATVPPDAGSRPSLRISASSSSAAAPHSALWRRNRVLRSGESAFSAEVRKPYSPSRQDSSRSLSTSATSSLSMSPV